MIDANDFLYCKNTLYFSEYVIIDGQIIKARDEDLRSVDVNRIQNLAESGNSNNIITIQEGRVQKIYGPKEGLDRIKDIISLIPYVNNEIEKHNIIFIPNK